jgi:sec-independent protein translocase protein TatC
MRKFFRGVWRVITFPFRLLWWLISQPFKAIKRVQAFLTFEPEDQPLGDIFARAVQQPSGLLEHLDALRKHLFRMVLAITIGMVICATFTSQIIDFLAKPIGGLSHLQAIDPTETIGVFMKVALWGGFSLATPYIAFELWLFAAPGVKARARRMSLIAIPLTLIFFMGGMYFANRFLLPTALPFLLNFLDIKTIPRVSSYTSFVTSLMFWIGVAFEFPLVVYVLTFMGFVKPRMLVQHWRIAVVLIAVLAAAITPTVDPVNMGLVMAPMIVLYFLSIGLSQMAVLGRSKK